MLFSERYGQLRTLRASVARESPSDVSEHVLQCIWYDQLFRDDALMTEDGRSLKVVSPGWWNHGEGPDFKGAQIEFNGRLRTGDVEIHLKHAGWRQHGHQMDSRYDDVLLHVVLDSLPPPVTPTTSSGRPVPSLLLSNFLEGDIRALAGELSLEEYPHRVEGTYGHCAGVVEAYGSERLTELLHLAGEWRMLFKARAMRERMERIGEDQAVYEALLYACGFAHFKHHFKVVARQLPFERAAQLARQDALLLEAALLQISGLLPPELPEGADAVPHFARLRGLRNAQLEGLRAIPLEWRRVGVRPINYPERRIAGISRFIKRVAAKGLIQTLDDVWAVDLPPIERRRAFEEMFPSAMGFWATHCTWTGKRMKNPAAPIGPGRVRSIIGNVIVPAALAIARKKRDRVLEERVMAFFAALPKEPENKIQRIMLPRIFGAAKPPRLDFRTQQGLLQMYTDWCEPNPSCRNCSVVRTLGTGLPKTDSSSAVLEDDQEGARTPARGPSATTRRVKT